MLYQAHRLTKKTILRGNSKVTTECYFEVKTTLHSIQGNTVGLWFAPYVHTAFAHALMAKYPIQIFLNVL